MCTGQDGLHAVVRQVDAAGDDERRTDAAVEDRQPGETKKIL
jgi:hypothetical protein